MKAYTGKILFIDLSTSEIRVEAVPDELYQQVLAGVGLGVYELYKHIPAGADPLGPQNVLGFVSGLLNGTPSAATGRWMVVCKSPLTGGLGEANCGGNLAPAIKQCGFDGIFITGKAKDPVYIFVDNKGAQIKSAAHVWGKDAIETEEILRQENMTKKRPSVAVIGQAGERLSLISGICNDGGRIAARSGVGAVMGSKQLKALVLAGTKIIGVDNPAQMKAISKSLSNKMRRVNVPGIMTGKMLPLMGRVMGGMKRAAPLDGMLMGMLMKKWGTPMNNGLGGVNGDTPIQNWKGNSLDFKPYLKDVNADLILEREIKKYHCNSCVIGCGGTCDISQISGGQFSESHKPEYETCAAFGALIMCSDLKGIFIINELLNRAGMDSISAGGTVAFAMECFEHGLLTKEQTDGIDLTWGNAGGALELVKKMIAREGIGDLLADGTRVAAQKIGGNAADYAIHAGGQEPGMHDSRMDPQLAVHYSADPTPGRHTIGSAQYYDVIHLWEKVSWAPNSGIYEKAEEFIPSEKVALKEVASSCYKELTDGAGGCLFAMTLGVGHWQLFEWLNAATGWNFTPDHYMEIGKRIQTMRQMFNIKHGIDPWQFKMKDRMAGSPPLKAGPLKGNSVPIADLMKLYWKTYGWDENTGIPTSATVASLGLDTLLAEAV